MHAQKLQATRKQTARFLAE